MPNHLEFLHAEHNEDIAKFIHTSGKSDSWTIIVCFYSALHFIRGKLFPLVEVRGGITKTYKSYDDYCTDKKSDGVNKHDRLVRLAYVELPNIAAKYNFLFNSSITARYNNYNFDTRYSKKAVEYLSAIKKECK